MHQWSMLILASRACGNTRTAQEEKMWSDPIYFLVKLLPPSLA